jgi:hypothetical protein
MQDGDIPTESYHHFGPADDEPTEGFPHTDWLEEVCL